MNTEEFKKVLQKECKHENTSTVAFHTVLSTETYDYQISLEVCANCRKIIGMFSRKDLTKSWYGFFQTYTKNKHELRSV